MADSEAITFQKLVKGHAYSVTGAEEVRWTEVCRGDPEAHLVGDCLGGARGLTAPLPSLQLVRPGELGQRSWSCCRPASAHCGPRAGSGALPVVHDWSTIDPQSGLTASLHPGGLGAFLQLSGEFSLPERSQVREMVTVSPRGEPSSPQQVRASS